VERGLSWRLAIVVGVRTGLVRRPSGEGLKSKKSAGPEHMMSRRGRGLRRPPGTSEEQSKEGRQKPCAKSVGHWTKSYTVVSPKRCRSERGKRGKFSLTQKAK